MTTCSRSNVIRIIHSRTQQGRCNSAQLTGRQMSMSVAMAYPTLVLTSSQCRVRPFRCCNVLKIKRYCRSGLSKVCYTARTMFHIQLALLYNSFILNVVFK